MKKLLTYLNGLSKPEQADFAVRCGTTVGYMRKACSKGEVLREKVCALIEANSDEAVKRVDLRPDDWWIIWPELKTRYPAPEQEAAHA